MWRSVGWKPPARLVRAAGFAAAAASVVAAGMLSALFVDYLAQRAQLRNTLSTPGEVEFEADAAGGAPEAPAKVAVVQTPAPRVAPAAKSETPAPQGNAQPPSIAAQVEIAPEKAAETNVAAAPPPGPAAAAAAMPPSNLPVATEDDSDQTFTAAIPARRLEPDLPDPATKPGPADTVTAAAPAEAAGRKGTVTKYVNLRAAPDNDAKIIVVVPAKARVGVLSCEQWCEVVFQGRKGWIYKSFVKS